MSIAKKAAAGNSLRRPASAPTSISAGVPGPNCLLFLLPASMSALSLQADIFLGFVVPETAGTFTQTLGPVQGLGRFFQQLGKGTFLVAAQDGAGGAAAEKLRTRQELADGAADLGTLAPDRLGVVHAAEDHHELVPAVAAEDVAVSGAPAQQLAEGFQQLAVMVVAAAVADFFQAAQIENIQCQRQVLLPQGIQRGMEAAAVQQTRQIVSADMVLQRALPRLAGG